MVALGCRMGRPDRPGRGGLDSVDRRRAEETREEGVDAGQGVSEGPRYYDYGPASTMAERVTSRATDARRGLHLRRPPSVQPGRRARQPLPAATAPRPVVPLTRQLGLGVSASTSIGEPTTGGGERDAEVPLSPVPRVPDLEDLVSATADSVLLLGSRAVPAGARAQAPPAPAESGDDNQPGLWLVAAAPRRPCGAIVRKTVRPRHGSLPPHRKRHRHRRLPRQPTDGRRP